MVRFRPEMELSWTRFALSCIWLGRGAARKGRSSRQKTSSASTLLMETPKFNTEAKFELLRVRLVDVASKGFHTGNGTAVGGPKRFSAVERHDPRHDVA